jgi:hypothetical protein
MMQMLKMVIVKTSIGDLSIKFSIAYVSGTCWVQAELQCNVMYDGSTGFTQTQHNVSRFKYRSLYGP